MFIKFMTASVIAVIIAAVIAVVVLFTGKTNLESAVADFENGNYKNAIIKLNNLIPLSDYETSEKIYYYRARSINKLADELDDDFEDKLKQASAGLEETPEFKKAESKINNALKKINDKTGADLKLIYDRPKSYIIPAGKFHDEFIAKYKGSSLIEDIDYEQLVKIEKTQENAKPLRSVAQFYNKYPNTPYIAGLVKMIFSQFQKDSSQANGLSETLLGILVSYGRRYPTSPEINLIYTCTGDGVNIRNSPGVNAQRVGSIPKDAVLLQLEKSMDVSQVGDVRDYWYRVANLNGQKGWIFGKFMKPFDISKYKIEETAEKWTLDENFASWSDSNTPENWRQMNEETKGAIGFINYGKLRLAVLNSKQGERAGIFARYNASRAFTILTRARYTGGDGYSVFVYSLGNEVFRLSLKNESADICGRVIPMHTADWHDYKLTSDDGKTATLIVDGEIISGRIPTVKDASFNTRGLYAMYSNNDEESKGEIEYIKAR